MTNGQYFIAIVIMGIVAAAAFGVGPVVAFFLIAFALLCLYWIAAYIFAFGVPAFVTFIVVMLIVLFSVGAVTAEYMALKERAQRAILARRKNAANAAAERTSEEHTQAQAMLKAGWMYSAQQRTAAGAAIGLPSIPPGDPRNPKG